MGDVWQAAEARRRFSDVVDAAVEGNSSVGATGGRWLSFRGSISRRPSPTSRVAWRGPATLAREMMRSTLPCGAPGRGGSLFLRPRNVDLKD